MLSWIAAPVVLSSVPPLSVSGPVPMAELAPPEPALLAARSAAGERGAAGIDVGAGQDPASAADPQASAGDRAANRRQAAAAPESEAEVLMTKGTLIATAALPLWTMPEVIVSVPLLLPSV